MPKLYYIEQKAHPSQFTRQAWETNESIIAQVLSFVSGILADDVVNEAEARALDALLNKRKKEINQIGFPLSEIASRVRAAAFDGVWTKQELLELKEQLTAFARYKCSEEQTHTSKAIYSDPQPTIIYPNSEFVTSGIFAWGARNKVLAAIEDRGGTVHGNPRISTTYLLVGSFSSKGWAFGNYGLKIEQALRMQGSGHHIAIIKEENWVKSLDSLI